MHEAGMAHDVLHAVERRAAGRTVLAAGIRVGASHRAMPEALAQGFTVLAQGSALADTELEVETVPGDELTLVWLRIADD